MRKFDPPRSKFCGERALVAGERRITSEKHQLLARNLQLISTTPLKVQIIPNLFNHTLSTLHVIAPTFGQGSVTSRSMGRLTLV